MLEPAPLITAVMSASSPARSRARIVSCTGNVAPLAPPHSTAMRRSVWYNRFCTLGHARVNRHPAPSRDVAYNLVARNRVAALRPVHQQITVAFDDQRRLAETQHALDGLNQRRRRVWRSRLLRLRGFAQQAR